MKKAIMFGLIMLFSIGLVQAIDYEIKGRPYSESSINRLFDNDLSSYVIKHKNSVGGYIDLIIDGGLGDFEFSLYYDNAWHVVPLTDRCISKGQSFISILVFDYTGSFYKNRQNKIIVKCRNSPLFEYIGDSKLFEINIESKEQPTFPSGSNKYPITFKSYQGLAGPPNALFDEDDSTFISPANFYTNVVRTYFVGQDRGLIWQVLDVDGWHDLIIPDECYVNNKVKLTIVARSDAGTFISYTCSPYMTLHQTIVNTHQYNSNAMKVFESKLVNPEFAILVGESVSDPIPEPELTVEIVQQGFNLWLAGKIDLNVLIQLLQQFEALK